MRTPKPRTILLAGVTIALAGVTAMASVGYVSATAPDISRDPAKRGGHGPLPSVSHSPTNGLNPDGKSCAIGWKPFKVGGRFSGCIGWPMPIPTEAPSAPVVTFHSSAYAYPTGRTFAARSVVLTGRAVGA